MEKEEQRKIRVIQMSKQNVRPDWYSLVYWATFLMYVIAVGSALFGAKILINSHMVQSNELFQVTLTFSDCNFHNSHSMMVYFDMMNAYYSKEHNLINMTQTDAMMAELTYSEDFYTAMNESIETDIVEMREKISAITIMLENSENLLNIGYSVPVFQKISSLVLDESRPEGKVNPIAAVSVLEIMKNYNLMIDYIGSNTYEANIESNNIAMFIITKGVDVLLNIVEKLTIQSRSSLEAESEKYNDNFRNILIITTGLTVLNFVLWIAGMIYQRRTFGTILSIFAVLDSRTIHVEMKRLSQIGTLLKDDVFNHKTFINKSKKMNYDLLHLNTASQIDLDDLFQPVRKLHKNKFSVLVESSKKEVSISQSSRFRYGMPIPVFIWIFILNLILLLFWGIEAVIMSRISSIVAETDLIRSLAMENTEIGMSIMKNFVAFNRVSQFSLEFYPKEKVKEFLDKLEFESTKRHYIQWWSKWQNRVKEIDSKNSVFELFQTKDICTMESPDPSMHPHQGKWPIQAEVECSKVFGGIFEKGFFSYIILVSTRFSEFYDMLEQELQLGVSTGMDKVTLQKNLAAVWFTKDYANFRFWNQLIFSRVLDVTSVYFDQEINDKTDTTIKNIEVLQIVGLVIMVAPLAFFLFAILPRVKRDYLVCISAFDLLSPLSLTTNQLVQIRFRKYFSLTGF